MDMNAIEVEPWRETRLRCGIGHEYRGSVRSIKTIAADMDGEPFYSGPYKEFDPPRCVVCGLRTWTTTNE